ncbi:MAG TPA: hypothetical protein VIG67_04635 [Yaniella sp.]
MSRVRRLIRGTGTAVIAGLVLSACSNTAFDTNAATKVLQSVDVNLDSTGAITDVAGQAVYIDEITGESDSSEESFAVEDVVDDLPVRISTRYETDEGTGTNLDDLDGHTGRVNIEVTVENLTLDSSELTYDVAGESRQTPALVGTPLSVAGSTELEDTRASDIILDAESGTTTNGVVSQTSEGDAVVQWGTVLAPPQSEATTTFQLVADVEDFSTPEIDIAVQAGFHTDMSFEGLLTSTFDTSGNSDYAMQQQAIELVAEVNDVLTRAGTTITDIRTTLDHTTETLGVDAAAQLKQNSDDMVSEMERVGEQMTALESQVDGSMTGAETAMNSQLSQIVASMNSMMGNTDATAPQLMQGQGCAATVEDSEMNGSLYSTFLVLGAQLDGYAEANAECRDEVVAEITNTLGPEVPDAEQCEDNPSITCTLFEAQVSVQDSLSELVESGKENVQNLVEQKVTDGALGLSVKIGTKIDKIRTELDSIEEREDRWEAVDEAIEDIKEIGGDFKDIYEHGTERLGILEDHTGSIQKQHSDIADELCSLIDHRNSPDDLRRKGRKINNIHEELVGEPCVEEPSEENPDDPSDNPSEDDQSSEVPSDETTPEPTVSPSDVDEGVTDEPAVDPTETPSETHTEDEDEDTTRAVSGLQEKDDSLNAQMQEHLDNEKAAWEEFLVEIGYEDGKFKDFEKAFEDLENSVDEAKGDIKDEAQAVDTVVERIDAFVGTSDNKNEDDLVSLHENLTNQLDELATELVDDTNQEFDEFENETSQKLPEDIDRQVRIVTDRVNSAQDSVIESYNSTIAGLATTSDAVINDTADQIDEQQSTLEEQQEATSSALSDSTTAVIEAIHDSTAASTRDLEGASAQLSASLNNVILDLGDPDIQGSGILGSMSASSAMSDTADYQLALASQRASGYANVRSEDIAEIMLRQAQFSASLEAAASLPAFHLDVPSGARSQTIYSFRIGGDGS